MLTPFQLNHLSEPVVHIYSEMENDILKMIAKRLRTDKDINKDNVLQWQMDKLQQMGDLNRDVIQLLADRSGVYYASIVHMVRDAGFISVQTMDAWLKGKAEEGKIKMAPEMHEDGAVMGLLNAYQRQAKDNQNLINSSMLSGGQQIYRDVLSKATAEVMSGIKSLDKSVADACSEWAEKGVPAMTDKRGRQWSVEAYVPMVMRSTANNVGNEMAFTRMDSYGVNLIQTSSHVGARPLCAPYQGKIYSLHGKEGGYPNFYTETSYGQPAGILGINCGHYIAPYIKGDPQTYHPYPKQQNDAMYAKLQKQRYYERQIRKAKTRLEMMKNLRNEQAVQKAKMLVRQRQAAIREYIKKNKLTREYPREQIRS